MPSTFLYRLPAHEPASAFAERTTAIWPGIAEATVTEDRVRGDAAIRSIRNPPRTMIVGTVERVKEGARRAREPGYKHGTGGVAESVYALDSKSSGLALCGFESHRPHPPSPLPP